MQIVFLDRSALPENSPIPRPDFAHQWREYEYTLPEQTLERAREADIIITSKVVFSREIMQQLPKLKLIALTATGTNNIDLVAAEELGIRVKNVAGYSAVTVPEHVIGFIFALKHSLTAWHTDALRGRWQNCKQFCYFDHPLRDVRGSTLGIIGKGCIGQEVGRLAQALGMQVLYAEHRTATDCRPGYTPFEQVLSRADIISLHCPLTEDTRHLINRETLALLKPGALLINTGRGPLIDEDALLEALRSGHLGGAALDVLTQEPPPQDHALMNAAPELPNLIITPHIAWASESALKTLTEKVRLNLEEFVATGK
ncbi:2-hydroxyacid dehydrogenase [Mesocricetibacter intestinalis]|uniref:2-hydroxyacid dehydrogenase n=1 Tax=Mesocricetibacter intestinalis TaxID=1521930 RepID=UPI001061161F|nr:2-hydroxyacid dehydrogenase [Mesocricetibacter intestinalis]